MYPKKITYLSETEVKVISCPPEIRREALLQLKAAQDERGRSELATAINRMLDRIDADWGGLLIKPDELGNPVGSIWVEMLSGKEANLWLPRSDCGYGPELLNAATCWASQHGLIIVKTVLDEKKLQSATLLCRNGFPKMVSLYYMSALTSTALKAPVTDALASFTHIDKLAPERLETVFSRIEKNSLDCPELQGIFTPQEALLGFYRQDEHAPEQWFLVRCEGEDAGVLLLAPHPAAKNWELMYMGLIPAWRGRGLGVQIVNEAIHRASEAGMEELILAVDERNTPALKLYKQLGFELRTACVVHAWIQKTS